MRAALLALVLLLYPALAQTPPPIDLFLQAASEDANISSRALAALAPVWKDAYTPLLIDAARFLPRSATGDAGERVSADPEAAIAFDAGARGPTTPAARTRARLIRFLEQRTGRRFGDDLGSWREWMWKLPYDPHPEYAAFKREIYGRIDPRMRHFFPPGVASGIRLDEIDWGGVGVNGIPPLVMPRVVDAAGAGYLKDSHIIFGIVINGQARAYPRRILAWHEMARDRVGGVDLAVVYCTLCGTVIPYESRAGGRAFTLGTSGLLYRSNKLMFDEETGSLWTTLTGEPAVGPLVGRGLALKAHPVVTTTWGEWRAAHPSTTVLSLETGHRRDYAEGAAYREYLATDRLMFRVPRTDRRLRNKDEVLGLLVPAQGGGRQAAAFDVRMLSSARLFQTEIEGLRFVVVTSPKGANRVYAAGEARFTAVDASGTKLIDNAGVTWAAGDDALVAPSGVRLARVPAYRAFWFGWYAQFPETLLFRKN